MFDIDIFETFCAVAVATLSTEQPVVDVMAAVAGDTVF